MAVKGKYLTIFLEEGRELLFRLNGRVLELEERPDDENALASALRLAHTLKGSSKMVGLDNVSRGSHLIENVLKSVLEVGDVARWKEVSSAVLQTLDGQMEVIDLIASGRESDARSLDPGGLVEAAMSGDVKKELPDVELTTLPESPTNIRIGLDKFDQVYNLIDDLTIQNKRLMARTRAYAPVMKEIVGLSPDGDGGLVMSTGQMRALEQLKDNEGLRLESYNEEVHKLNRLIGEVHDRMLELRMMPVVDLFENFRRYVRDVGRELGKEVELQLEDMDTMMDRSLVDAVKGPLTHLLSNAIDHGIESAEERKKLGKPAQGRVRLRALHKTGAVVIEVEDDGKGLDPERIRRISLEKGYITRSESESLTDEDVLYLICRPGFTSRTKASDLSGRGVGLDVVGARLEKVQGDLKIDSEKGSYTRFSLYLPESVSMMPVLEVEAEGHRYGLPAIFVRKCLNVTTKELGELGGCVRFEGRELPLVSLGQMLASEAKRVKGIVPVVVLHFRGLLMALQVDDILRESELVIKTLGEYLQEVPYLQGACILADGGLAPVINIMDLAENWQEFETLCGVSWEESPKPLKVLVVDDAATSRYVESTIIERLGHEVVQATDGNEALDALEQEDFDLVVTDVMMPNVDGLSLLKQIRESEKWCGTPVIVVSMLAEDADAESGFEAGANAYLPKNRLNTAVLRRTLRNIFTGRQ